MFSKEQLEGMIITLRENVSLLERALLTNPDDENMKSMLESQKKSLNGYLEQLKNIKVGRPAIGITKKVSLTLSQEQWDWLDKKADGNRSRLLRTIVSGALETENEWSRYGALGYAIAGAKKLGYDNKQINDLIASMDIQFDRISVPEAEEIYWDSDY